MKLGFFGVLTIAFIILKITGNIAWSWIWVLSPVWLPITLAIIFLWFVFAPAKKKKTEEA